MQEEEDGAASYASIDEVRELVHAIGLDPEALKLSVRMERAVHDSLSKAAPTLRKSVRSAIELELSALDGPEPTGPVSKLGGVPWLKPDDQWPVLRAAARFLCTAEPGGAARQRHAAAIVATDRHRAGAQPQQWAAPAVGLHRWLPD